MGKDETVKHVAGTSAQIDFHGCQRTMKSIGRYNLVGNFIRFLDLSSFHLSYEILATRGVHTFHTFRAVARTILKGGSQWILIHF